VQLLLAAYTADFAGKLRRAACCGHNGNLSASWLFVFRFSPQTAEEVKAVANWPIEDCDYGHFPLFSDGLSATKAKLKPPPTSSPPLFTLFFIYFFFV